MATAHAAGSQAHVLPVDTSSKVLSTASVPSTAPIGITPPPIALPRHIRSGCRSHSSAAKSRPVRPNPVLTSSRHSSQPYSWQSASSAVQKPAGGTTTPPEPRTGSITTPATSVGSTAWKSIWSRMKSMVLSPEPPGRGGANGVRYGWGYGACTNPPPRPRTPWPISWCSAPSPAVVVDSPW